MMLGAPPSALITARLGMSPMSRRINRAGMSEGWMRRLNPHRNTGNRMMPRLVASHTAFV